MTINPMSTFFQQLFLANLDIHQNCQLIRLLYNRLLVVVQAFDFGKSLSLGSEAKTGRHCDCHRQTDVWAIIDETLASSNVFITIAIAGTRVNFINVGFG